MSNYKHAMKKIILGLSLFVLLSCSSDDGGADVNMAVTSTNLKGEYTITELVRPDGSIVQYVGQCGMLKDYIAFDLTKVSYYSYDPNCSNYSTNVCYSYEIVDKRITGCNYIFDGKISEFTGQRMRLDFYGVIPGDHFHNSIGDAKGFILVRRE